MPSPANNKHPVQKFLAGFIVAAWIVLLGLAVVNRQHLLDWWALRDYQATADITALAAESTMTDYSRKVFYVNKPSVQDRQQFFANCPEADGEHTIVLGCYDGNRARIYILNVTNPQLDGVKKVTAAHEMLHAAYDRLSDKDRRKVDAMLQSYYKNGLTDERVKRTIEAYKKTEPNDIVNEMHSIFGTEIPNLPADLENYYTKYFDDRSAVVSFAANYQAEFTSRRDQVERYDAQLASIKAALESLESDLAAKQSQINAEQARLDGLRSSNQIAAYNAGIASYNALIDAYNAQVAEVKHQINYYNSIVAVRNEVALEEGRLVQELSGDKVDTINN